MTDPRNIKYVTITEETYDALRNCLKETANKLYEMATEAHAGSWSTQHVTPMRAQADKINKLLFATEGVM